MHGANGVRLAVLASRSDPMPNSPNDENRPRHPNESEPLGIARPTPGLNKLDQVREASMADEGGASGAVMESEDGDVLRHPTTNRPTGQQHWAMQWFHANATKLQWAGFGALAVIGLVLARRSRG
jgi:hypothetical protein